MSGISIGTVTEFWLCYILSTCDHRLQNVEDWSESRLDLLRILSGDSALSSLDFTDDKLGLLLEKIGDCVVWGEIEQKINANCLSVYRLGDNSDFSTFRLDAAPMQSHGEVSEGGLLQYGYHEHHADLPQFKIKLCTLDNELNHFAYIEEHKSLLGWQVYATNAPQALLGFEKCVFKYRHQWNIESSFDDLRNKVAHLVRIYLQKQERIKGLVNLLLLALNVCAVTDKNIEIVKY